MLDAAMNADENRPDKRRARQVEKAVLPNGPARRLRDALYELYLRADAPTLDELAARIADDEDLPGSPKRDTISRIISGRELPADKTRSQSPSRWPTFAVAIRR